MSLGAAIVYPAKLHRRVFIEPPLVAFGQAGIARAELREELLRFGGFGREVRAGFDRPRAHQVLNNLGVVVCCIYANALATREKRSKRSGSFPSYEVGGHDDLVFHQVAKRENCAAGIDVKNMRYESGIGFFMTGLVSRYDAADRLEVFVPGTLLNGPHCGEMRVARS